MNEWRRWERQSVSPCVYLCEFIQMNDDIFSGYTYNYLCTHHHIHPKSSGRTLCISIHSCGCPHTFSFDICAYKVKYRQRRCFCNCIHADFTRGYVVSGREEEDARRTVPRLQLLFLPQGMLIRDGRVRSLLPRSTPLHCHCGPERELKNLNQVSHNSH